MEATSTHGQNNLFIYVNRRRFTGSHGVKSDMTGAEISALVRCPADNAVIDRETAPDVWTSMTVDQTVRIESGMHFMVTREHIVGG